MHLNARRLLAVLGLALVACAPRSRPVGPLPPEVLQPWTTQPGDMVRISVGLEHIDDILWDIDQALEATSR